MSIEIFKDIPGYEGLYQVSNLGNVKSLSRISKNSGSYNGFMTIREKILNPALNNHGYYTVFLCKDGKNKRIKVHQLVTMSFLNHLPDKTQEIVVDHINNIKTDNRLENLQLISHRENSSKDRKRKFDTGVYLHKTSNKYRAQIQINNKKFHLGSFDTEIEASKAYQKALEMYNNGDLSFMKSIKISSKYKGVSFDKNRNKWVSYININKKRKHIGYFNTEIEAHKALQKALKEVL